MYLGGTARENERAITRGRFRFDKQFFCRRLKNICKPSGCDVFRWQTRDRWKNTFALNNKRGMIFQAAIETFFRENESQWWKGSMETEINRGSILFMIFVTTVLPLRPSSCPSDVSLTSPRFCNINIVNNILAFVSILP